ncbi:beta-glucosidase [Microbacterium terrae]|uniref:Thermostable beta-glucosidase B n=1 Tax=Microbacterium terrae TaxID=69369 RepID=A0A0M2H1T9_9MICO|nr:glycoside hydrolase family 3 C-terminal domain-containing protein [Microbacterium terrae]KJL37533.1 Thermostable beta-glucosidase B [Microbacterium terrae]MBP1076362.1 beta-glucosidase [Microbacterium terrae]GLJ97186.1 beta-glucosidase [Microbacterium terrae]
MTQFDFPGTIAAETSAARAFDAAVDRVREGEHPLAAAADLWLELTPAERLWLLDGDVDFWPGMRSLATGGYHRDTPYVMGAIERVGLPGIRFSDGPRGAVREGSTAFPVAMARGATWDVELEERVGVAIGTEAREHGANYFGGVCINLPRHPAWGRVQEVYSDQPLLLGAMGAAVTRGAQRNVMACMKHFALNSMENARFEVDVKVDEATLHEVYLPHFKHVVEAGVASVMSSYNASNGEWNGQNPYLLTQVLRDDWGFEGAVITDFVWGLRDAAASLSAGLDVEAPYRQQRASTLESSLESGESSWDDVERSGVRIIGMQLTHYARRLAEEPHGTLACPEHTALAREAATRAMVLLKNDTIADDAAPVLPFDGAGLRTLAVVGRLADVEVTGDRGSSSVLTPYVVTPLQGLRAALPDADVVTADAAAGASGAAEAAQMADAAIVVVGYTAEDEGEFIDGSLATREELTALYPEPRDDQERADQEVVIRNLGAGRSVVGTEGKGGDRRQLHLRPEDVETIRAVAAANPRTVVVIVGAGAVLMHEWIDLVPSVVIGWYAGTEGGNALADVLLGARTPSGRLPYAIPASDEDLPAFDKDAKTFTYDRWYGQRLLQRRGVDALFPLGFGLSYTTVDTEALAVDAVDAASGRAAATVTVRNTGARDVHHVVQVYGSRVDGERAGERELLGFTVTHLSTHQVQDVPVALDLTPLGRWDAASRTIVVAEGPIVVEASAYWGDSAAVRAEVVL